MILVDSNIIFDILDRDPVWCEWSLHHMRKLSILDELGINTIIYAEVSPRFRSPAALDRQLDDLRLTVFEIPLHAAFLAGKAHFDYRRQRGSRTSVLPDFFIGAHAAVLGCAVLTRDTRRYASYFPTVRLICP